MVMAGSSPLAESLSRRLRFLLRLLLVSCGSGWTRLLNGGRSAHFQSAKRQRECGKAWRRFATPLKTGAALPLAALIVSLRPHQLGGRRAISVRLAFLPDGRTRACRHT